MPLTAHVTHVLRIARIGLGTGIRQPCVIGTMTECVVQIPQGIAPAASIAIRVATAPPRGIPVQPISADDVTVEDEIIDERHLIQLRDRVIVIVIVGHVVAGDEIDQGIPVRSVAIFLPGTAPSLEEINVVAALIVIPIREIAVVHLLPVLIDAPVLAVDVEDAALTGPFVEVQVGEGTQRLAVGVTNMSTAGVGVVVVGRRLEDQTLEFAAFGDVEELGIDHIIIAHLVAGDVVKPLLRVCIGIVAVFVRIALGFHPEGAILVEELDVHGLIPEPGAILQSGAADAHHPDGVVVVPEEVGIGLDETGGQHPGGVHRYGPDHHRLEQTDGRNVRQAHVGRLVTIEGVENLHTRLGTDVEGKGVRMVSGSLTHGGHRGIALEEKPCRTCIGGIRRGQGADFPDPRPVQIPRPAVVFLVGGHIRAIGIALHDGT